MAVRLTSTFLAHSSWRGSVQTRPYLHASFCMKRMMSSLPSKQPPQHQETTDIVKGQTFTMFYKFPYILHARFLGRLKLYQTGLCLVSLPVFTVMGLYDLVSMSSVYCAYGVASFATVMLFAMSAYLRRIVGIMSISKDVVKISHLTFWGGRRDLYVKTADLVPLSELPDKPGEMLIKLRRYDNPDYLFLCINYGGIVDRDKFETVFGRIDLR